MMECFGRSVFCGGMEKFEEPSCDGPRDESFAGA